MDTKGVGGYGGAIVSTGGFERKGSQPAELRLVPAGSNSLGAKGELKNAVPPPKPEKESFKGKLLSMFSVSAKPQVPEKTLRAQAAVTVALESNPGYSPMLRKGADIQRFVDFVLQTAKRNGLESDSFAGIAASAIKDGWVEKDNLVSLSQPGSVKQDGKAVLHLPTHEAQEKAPGLASSSSSSPAVQNMPRKSDSVPLTGRHLEVMVLVTKNSLATSLETLVSTGTLDSKSRDALLEHMGKTVAELGTTGLSKTEVRDLAADILNVARLKDQSGIAEWITSNSQDIDL